MPLRLVFSSKKLALKFDQERLIKLPYFFRLIFFSFVAFCLLASHPPAFAQATTVEMVFDSLKQFETELKNINSADRTCRQAIQLSVWARFIPRLRRAAEERAEAEWREEIEWSNRRLAQVKEYSLESMNNVFFQLSQNDSRMGDLTTVDPAIRNIIFPLVKERISRAIAETVRTDITISEIDYYLFYTLEVQLRKAMRELLAYKVKRGLELFNLNEQIVNNNPMSQSSPLNFFVNELLWQIATTATNSQMVDAMIESGMKDLWELCPGCR